ncbi:MAG: allophanate hydrolase [marine bacterium B5-7]|nr:MAG: allophanate hydrolase [marine bacterium B5-7]
MTQQNYSLSISELHARYRKGLLSPETLIADIIAKIKSFEDHNIWIHLLNADELEVYLSNLQGKGPDDLPLYGIPFAIKDNIDLVGIPTTAACPEFSYIPEANAFAVQLLIDAGAIPIGKTNLDQFAAGLVGTRSPYGAVKNAFDPAYISGGSSSGSAVAVALGQVSFSLGTDTAGSGRVPVAFNNLVGLKPTKGRISTSGLVPACRSLDCISIFALNPDDVATVFDIVDCYDPADIYSRVITNHTGKKQYKIGVPGTSFLKFFGNENYENLFGDFVNEILKGSIGRKVNDEEDYEIVKIDFTPFIKTAKLLYQGPWLAERYAAIDELIESNPDALFPVTKDIVLPAKDISAVETFKRLYELQALKKETDKILEQVDFVVTPTAGTKYRIEEVNDEPVQLNSNLGYYTNFMNLLDYAAIAIPAGFDKDDFPFGVTLFSHAFTDHQLLKQAIKLLDGNLVKMGATDFKWMPKQLPDISRKTENTIDIAVCGAHLSGMPLNHQLTDNNAVLIKATKTEAAYKLYVLAGGPPLRPGLVRDSSNGKSIEVEVWRIPLRDFGKFMINIPSPLGIGKASLEDGKEVNSFICESFGIEGAEDITDFGGWRNYMKQCP